MEEENEILILCETQILTYRTQRNSFFECITGRDKFFR